MSNRWKTIMTAVVLAWAASGAAVADGYEPVGGGYASSSVHSWTGLYVGASVGWADVDMDWAFNPPFPASPNQAFSFNDDNLTVGGLVGYQHQFGAVVVGIEAAYRAFTDNDFALHDGYGVDFGSFAAAKVDDLFTVGGRLGYAWGSQWLLYATGGYATAQVETALISKASGLSPNFNTDERHHGWYIGGGVEHEIASNLIFGIDYQHVDLDTEHHSLPPFNAHDMDADIDLVTARLIFRLGGEREVPVPLK